MSRGRCEWCYARPAVDPVAVDGVQMRVCTPCARSIADAERPIETLFDGGEDEPGQWMPEAEDRDDSVAPD
jgi:ribosome-binding protein aMBF1 (putative translation factor)